MQKYDMREWICSLEAIIDNKLKKWEKLNSIENGEAAQKVWRWTQTFFLLDIFWEDGIETVVLKCISPRVDQVYRWHGLTDRTFNKVQDRVGNLAQIVMHPPIDPFGKP